VTLATSETIEGNNIVVCCGNSELLAKYKPKILLVKVLTCHFESAEGLPPMLDDNSVPEGVFATLDRPGMTGYKFGFLNVQSEESLIAYAKKRFPNSKITHFQSYDDIRDEHNNLMTLVERDSETGVIYFLGSPFRDAPLNAHKVMDMIHSA
jgi:hypothetical protein